VLRRSLTRDARGLFTTGRLRSGVGGLKNGLRIDEDRAGIFRHEYAGFPKASQKFGFVETQVADQCSWHGRVRATGTTTATVRADEA
jgi:hypothetical protein